MKVSPGRLLVALSLYRIRSRAAQIILQKATASAEGEPDGGDGESELAEFVMWFISGNAERMADPEFSELVRWGHDTFGTCPECHGMLGIDDNAWPPQWVNEETYCSYTCADKVTDEAIKDVLDRMERWFSGVTGIEDWELTPQLRAATEEHISGENGDNFRYEGDVEDAVRHFWEDYDYNPYIHPNDQGEPWVT